jgi:hypothetical protein
MTQVAITVTILHRKFNVNPKMAINYTALVANLSGSRLKTYKTRMGCASDAEAIKLFFLFQDISSHLFTPLQMLEVTLRNGIHSAVKNKRGQADWYNHITLSKQSKNHLALAQSSANSDLVGIRVPTTDDIICRLPFGFWVYMLDAPYRNTAPSMHIWDRHTHASVFPNAGGNGTKAIFARLKLINSLRNRLFHHEPVWNGHHIASTEQALAKIKNEYRNITEVTGWMAPEIKGLLSAWGFDGRLALACDATRFDRRLW